MFRLEANGIVGPLSGKFRIAFHGNKFTSAFSLLLFNHIHNA